MLLVLERARVPVTGADWVWPDDNADRLLASNHHSRYEAYLDLGLAGIDDVVRRDVLGDPVGFALWAWRQAIPPAMSPGYVDWREPIASVRLLCPWDGGVAAELVVRVPPPVRPAPWRTGRAALDEPAGDRVILGQVILRLRLPDVVDAPPGTDADLEHILVAAKNFVAQACKSVNDGAAEPLVELSELWVPANRQLRQPPSVALRSPPLR